MNRSFVLTMIFISVMIAFISCSKELSFESNNAVATGSLHDATGNCFTPSIHGTYTKGAAVTDSNYVTVQVNVTAAGKYTLATDTVNGFSFSNSGNFSSAGIQNVNLKASGKPLISQATTFTLIFDTTVCSFTINVNDSARVPNSYNSDTAWTFTEAGRKYNGYMDTAYTRDTVAFGHTFRILQMQGSTAATGDSVFLMSITFPGGNVATGSYTSNTSTFFRYLGSYNINDTLYSASPLTPTVTTSVTITSYDPTAKLLNATFSGTAKNKAGGTVNITSGRIHAKLN